MSKRLYNDHLEEEPKIKKHKIHKTNINYITLIINENYFNEYSLDELRETSYEISKILTTVLKHKEKIDNILSIYT